MTTYMPRVGGAAELATGFVVIAIVEIIYPEMPVSISLTYVTSSLLVAVLIGLVAGLLPARTAARLEPLEALRTE